MTIRNVHLVDVMNGSLHPEQTVVISGNRITAVGPADQIRIPRNAEIVDG